MNETCKKSQDQVLDQVQIQVRDWRSSYKLLTKTPLFSFSIQHLCGFFFFFFPRCFSSTCNWFQQGSPAHRQCCESVCKRFLLHVSCQMEGMQAWGGPIRNHLATQTLTLQEKYSSMVLRSHASKKKKKSQRKIPWASGRNVSLGLLWGCINGGYDHD